MGRFVLPAPVGINGTVDRCELSVEGCAKLQVARLGTSRKPGLMLERFIRSIDPSNLLELAFELIWDKYVDDDIGSVTDIPAWEPIDDALCTLARCIRERKLSVILSVVAPQSTDLGKVKMGTLFTKFRERGSITLRYFTDHLPPVSFTTSFRRAGAHRALCRAYTPKICLCWQWADDALAVTFFEIRCSSAIPMLPCSAIASHSGFCLLWHLYPSV